MHCVLLILLQTKILSIINHHCLNILQYLGVFFSKIIFLAIYWEKKVKKGDIIGYVGNTGRSKGFHLHYEVHKDGKRVNPVNYFYSNLSPEEFDEILRISSQENQSLD